MKKIMFLMIAAMLSFSLVSNATNAQYQVKGLLIHVNPNKSYLLAINLSQVNGKGWETEDLMIKGENGLNIKVANQDGDTIFIESFFLRGKMIPEKYLLEILDGLANPKEAVYLKVLNYRSPGNAFVTGDKKRLKRLGWTVTTNGKWKNWITVIDKDGIFISLRTIYPDNMEIFLVTGVGINNKQVPIYQWEPVLKKLEAAKKLNRSQ